mmetsp:Transcript_132740/g.424703  ORF Transcript_132740/g.424703 Transcript_132740/m.424703 type:complete len:106 (+) Transcript_132740:209-526(+)
MDDETFEEYVVDGAILGRIADYLKQGDKVDLVSYTGRLLEVEVKADMVDELLEKRLDQNRRGNAFALRSGMYFLTSGIWRPGPDYLEVGDKVSTHPKTGKTLRRL